MYVTSAYGKMGCSVNEVSNLVVPTVQELRKVKHAGLNLCVTSWYQKKAEKVLKEAGWIVLIKYKNYHIHNGSECKLWGAVRKKNEAVIAPEIIKKVVREAVRKEVVKKRIVKPNFRTVLAHIKKQSLAETRKILIKAGIITSKGQLTKKYQSK